MPLSLWRDATSVPSDDLRTIGQQRLRMPALHR
jgi:hypothetical protein